MHLHQIVFIGREKLRKILDNYNLKESGKKTGSHNECTARFTSLLPSQSGDRPELSTSFSGGEESVREGGAHGSASSSRR